MFKLFNDLIRFLIELISIGLLVIVGFKADTLIIKLILSLGVPLTVLFFWSKYMAPASATRFNEPQRVLAEIILFGGVACYTYFNYDKKIAIVYLSVAAINTLLDHLLS